MKTIRVGINGFGRMVFCAAQNRKDIQVAGINDLLDIEYIAYILKYDSIHGQFERNIEVEGDQLVVNGNRIVLKKLKKMLSKEMTK